MKGKTLILVTGLCLLMVAQTALSDGMIIPVRPDVPIRGHWSVKNHNVKMTVRDQVASVHIDQAFVNHSRANLEVEYVFPIPPDAAIDSLTMVVDGKELTGKILDAKEARRIYEDIVRSKKDPALLEYVGYGMYRTRAFPIEPGKEAHVVVTYKTVCRKDRDLVEVFYPLNTEKYSAQKIESVSVTVDIKADADITAVYSPTHDLKVDRKDARHVIAEYAVKDALPDTDFQVYYKAADEKIGATVLAHRSDEKKDGYFMVLVSPNPKTASEHAVSKDVVIVLDRSGSMAHNDKIGQAKQALSQVIGSLGAEDRFNVVTFCDAVDVFFTGKGLMDATKDNREKASDLTDRIEPTGGTNIAEAVTTAMGLFDEKDRPRYVLFVTDGIPTVGERDEGAILKLAEKANDKKVRLFALGVGYDVNVRLIDKLVKGNHGVSDYVKPKEPLEAKVSNLYNKIKRPVMTGVKLGFADVRTTMTYPAEVGDLFDGDQIVWVGRYGEGGKTTLTVAGKLEGKEQKFEYPAMLDKNSESSRNSFVERLWAARRVGFLLDQIQLNGESKEVVEELVKLSKQYGIMTPYTAFLADERVALGATEDHRRRAGEAADMLAKSSTGYAGQAGAAARSELNTAARPASAPAGAVPEGKFLADADGLKMDRAKLAPAAREARQIGWAAGGRSGSGPTEQAQYEAGKDVTLSNVMNVGNQTLFRRGQVWYAPGTEKLDLEKDKEKIQVVERFSDEYFKLIEKNTIDQNRVFASQRSAEELVVELRGQVYLVK